MKIQGLTYRDAYAQPLTDSEVADLFRDIRIDENEIAARLSSREDERRFLSLSMEGN